MTPRIRPALLLVVGCAFALVLADTTAFSRNANIVTGLGLVVAAVAIAIRWSWHAGPRPSGAYRPWLVLFVVGAVWEAYCYLARGPRSEHPTFSSMSDAVDRTYLLKALVVLAWAALGYLIVRRGSKAPQ